MTRNKLLLFSLTLLTTLPLSVRAEKTSGFTETWAGRITLVSIIVGVFVVALFSEVSWDSETLKGIGLCIALALGGLFVYLNI